MNKQEGVIFLFTIVKEIQHSFTTPVIYFTQKDYARNIFNTFKNIHNAILKKEPPEKVADIVCSFHVEWLDAVQEIEMFSKRIKDTPREVIDTALEYTMDCTELRYNDIVDYVEEMESIMSEEESQFMQIDLTILKDMKDTVINTLNDKEQYIRSQADQTEYLARINDEIKELLHWLDRLNDSLAIEVCKVLHFKIPLTPRFLRKTTKQIIEDYVDSTSENQMVSQLLLPERSFAMTSAERMDEVNEIQIVKVTEKIRALQSRMSRLRVEDSPGLMALKHKTMFLEERLQSMENIKNAMKRLREQAADENVNEFRPLNIFNHLLPHQHRCDLIDKLLQLWNNALTEKQHDLGSIIDILSVVNIKPVYSDENGNFTVDKYGRKIYTVGKDEMLYQLNEHNTLVPLNDDEEHIYFYDACGRYYTDAGTERIYKHHRGASEYMLNSAGRLVKVFEIKNGVEYFYDHLGRYYVNKQGHHIYQEDNSDGEYEHDGLGNLVKIHEEPVNYAPCPIEPITTEENKYLKKEVGEALKICIAEVVLRQPHDPIACLADLLTKYSYSIKAHQKHLQDEQERFEMSQLIPKENSTKSYYEDEATVDLNLLNYQHSTDLSLTSF